MISTSVEGEMTIDPALLTASEAQARLVAGELTAEALARACLARVELRDPLIKAWSYVDSPLVLAEARDRDSNGATGTLHGIPIGVKDVILTKDMPTQYNSPIYRGHHSKIDASCVANLRAAGAVIFGKTDTLEFAASGRRAVTRNPHDLERTPGGSSSGSAAAVADFHVPIALGTQTGGSMIRPASFCGVYGMKPTWNLVSNEGAKMFSASLDTIGWYARSADDLALVYDVFDLETEAAQPLDLSSSRIAICRSPVWDSADPATRNALESAADLLRTAGAEIVDLTLPKSFDGLVDAQLIIMFVEGRATFLSEYRNNHHLLHQEFRDMVENARGYTRRQLLAAYNQAAACRAEFDEIAAEYDAVLTPSVVGEAPVGLAFTGAFTFNAMWTLLQTPVVNVPGFIGPNALPIGLSVVGPRFSDRKVLAAAKAFGPLFAGKRAAG
jgi:Asp-tRNA(Asn)/Glu-tRNA(Gln) amidotransferase A subunit family amidase